jgi:hypothetical protein
MAGTFRGTVDDGDTLKVPLGNECRESWELIQHNDKINPAFKSNQYWFEMKLAIKPNPAPKRERAP